MTADIAKVREHYKTHGQEHVFKFYDSLSDTEKEEFNAQFKDLDLARIDRIFKNAMATSAAATSGKLEPLPKECFESVIVDKKDEHLHSLTNKIKKYEKTGLELIAQGKVRQKRKYNKGCRFIVSGRTGNTFRI
jgi:UDP-N-acetylglucosamine/UDP-N-acetylgalactosamine diphosphorylase